VKFNLILFSCSLLLLSTAAVFEVNYLSYRSPVPYSNWKTITFYYFKGYKRPGQTLFGDKEFAFIRVSRETRFINDTTIEAITCFHPSRSYVFEQQIRSPGLLQHELYHFHIAEYCTRLLRKDLLEHSVTFTGSGLAALNEKYADIEQDMQVAYDDEPYHSYVLQEQKRWEHDIDSALVQLASYSNTVIHLKKGR
jgi:hypothetical protein